MAQLPIDTRLKIEQAIEDGLVKQEPRPYLGISSIGASCARQLWYGFRMCGDKFITKRVERLFQRGHREEAIIQEDFKKIGIIYHSDQREVTTGDGHIRGHIDDILENVPDAPKTPHLGEYKTHNDKSFKDLKKKGMKLSKPVHYAQMVCYMDALKLKRGLYVAVNKNDDERYYERISSDRERAKELINRAWDIISSVFPMPKIGNSTWYECKWCDYYELCHFGAPALKNCRTCKFCDLHPEATWKCDGLKIELAFGQQKLGCSRHKYIEGLV